MNWLAIGLFLLYAALAVVVFVVMAPPHIHRPLAGDEPAAARNADWLSHIDRGLARLTPAGVTARLGAALDVAGWGVAPARLVTWTTIWAAMGVVLMLLAESPIMAVVAVVTTPLVARIIVRYLAGRRRRAFVDQLDDTLQLLAGSLRSGNSLLSAIAAVADQAAAPTSHEFARALNEIRLGRDLGEVLADISRRMHSVDFEWVGQAVDIHREVGGNLAEVLDQVSQTIRERNQLRRQVHSLSADGRLSAYVLIAMPLVIVALLLVINPGYLQPLTESALGWSLLAISVLLFVVGGVWLRRLITVKL